MKRLVLSPLLICVAAAASLAAEPPATHWLPATAYAVPKETAPDGEGYFSIIEGRNGRLYIGTHANATNSWLVEFDPAAEKMKPVVDAHQAIGTDAKGFAAQAKIHTRNNVGASGKIYFGTKQGYPAKDEKWTDYPGGYPMVYDPATGKTQVFPIPVPHQGISGITPDEARGVAYISTCSDHKPGPNESAHFLVLDLKTGKYRDLIDAEHVYAFIVVDHQHRAYHPLRGGDIARYDPATKKLERLKQTIDGKPPAADSHLADEKSHAINWDISPDGKTLYCVPMKTNQLYAYDLTVEGDTLPGRNLGPLVADVAAGETDCRALCVGPTGQVWAAVTIKGPKGSRVPRLVSYRAGDAKPNDHGQLSISNPDFTQLTDAAGKPLKFHGGITKTPEGVMTTKAVLLGICQGHDGAVYVLALQPYTVLRVAPDALKPAPDAAPKKKVALLLADWFKGSHPDVLFTRIFQTYSRDGRGVSSKLQIASVYRDLPSEKDLSALYSVEHGFAISSSVQQALTLGTGKLAVDAVFISTEWAPYPISDTGQFVYPHRRIFEECVKVFKASGRVVPVFIDKHLADTHADSQWIYDTAKEMKIPLMAGSSVPLCLHAAEANVEEGAELKQIVGISYHTLTTYGFHGLEMTQALAERRKGGETGIKQVRCITGEAVWEAAGKEYDPALLEAALEKAGPRIPKGKTLQTAVKEPILFVIDHVDGLRVNLFTLNGAVAGWSAAWSYKDGRTAATLFASEAKHDRIRFDWQMKGIEDMVLSGRPSWTAERTLFSSATLDAGMISKRDGGKLVPTPFLMQSYKPDWSWHPPAEMMQTPAAK
jgi:hypothetical protein